MNNDLDQIEEEIKEKEDEKKKRKVKVSGRSVFKLKEIIQKKGQMEKPDDDKDE